jgi:hypothetical protein
MKHLQRHCQRFGSALHFMPEGMSRREQNDSFVAAAICQWRTEWLFDHVNVKLVEKFDDTRTWRECLAYFLVPSTSMRAYFEEKVKNQPIVVPLLPRGSDGEWQGKRTKSSNGNDGSDKKNNNNRRGRGGARGRGRGRGGGANKRVRLDDDKKTPVTDTPLQQTSNDSGSSTTISTSPTPDSTASSSTSPIASAIALPQTSDSSSSTMSVSSLSSSPPSLSSLAITPPPPSLLSSSPPSSPADTSTSSAPLSSLPVAAVTASSVVDLDAPEEVRRDRTVEVKSTDTTGSSSMGGEGMRRALRQAAERKKKEQEERDKERLKTGAWKKETIEVVTSGDETVNGRDSDDQKIADIAAVGDAITKMVAESFRDNSIIRAQLPDYIKPSQDDLSTLRLFLRVAYSPANAATYYDLPLDTSIRDSLKGYHLVSHSFVHVYVVNWFLCIFQ